MHDSKSREKKNPSYTKRQKQWEDAQDIYIHVCSHMGIQKMSHKNKVKCTGFSM